MPHAADGSSGRSCARGWGPSVTAIGARPGVPVDCAPDLLLLMKVRVGNMGMVGLDHSAEICF